MGTSRPHVEIAAATLAGGDTNQDRYAYGDGWAFVLDGASSFAKTQPGHDGGWYAERLMQALAPRLTDQPERATPEIVADSIRTVAELHGADAAGCPTSTIALAQWTDQSVEIYLLGDSTAALITANGEEEFSDSRLDHIAAPIRQEYRSRLAAGFGFDERHRELLQQLQAEQSAARNQPNGYHIAGAEPKAAHNALTCSWPRSSLRTAVLATDGAASGLRYGVFPSWSAMKSWNLGETLQQVHDVESSDPTAARWPRSKTHDDKTLLRISFGDG